MADPYKRWCYYAMAVDPIHVGSGGYRLGRVDNAILREPGTNLPKIPGSSIAGVTRAYTAMQVEHAYPGCAGKGGESGEKHCGKCEVCLTFGFSKDKASFQGLAQFFDARIVFFPVRSMKGPVWVTCPSVLYDFRRALAKDEETIAASPEVGDEEIVTNLPVHEGSLNLGWLLLRKRDGRVECTIPDALKQMRDRLVMVSDGLFSHIVNDNLEVRTSVAIDPNTGAHEDKALFSYEAIPRSTVLWFDVVFNKPGFFKPPSVDSEPPTGATEGRPAPVGDLSEKNEEWVQSVVQKGLDLMPVLGVGGMGTRGMGRLRVLNLKAVSPAGKEQGNGQS